MSYKIEKPRDDQERKHAFDKLESERVFARPFDASELDSLPQPTDDDPPYRPWWVIDRD